MSPAPQSNSDTEDTLIPPHLAHHTETWVDVGLTLRRYPPPPEVYAQLLHETELLLKDGQADLCFFIHKPPGLRWRLRAADGRLLTELRRAATAAAGRVLRPDLVRAAVYEPQQALFGGPLSMEFVHQTWCADSMLWMRWHAENARPSVAARWEISFSVLAHLFRKLGVVGWEDREVWDCVVEDTGRRLAEREWSRPEVVAMARSLRDRWSDAWGTSNTPPRSVTNTRFQSVHDFSVQTGPVLTDWHANCLSQPATQQPLTPRRAAAYWTVFHWNRAGLTAAQQALTTQTLAGRHLAA